MRKRSTDHALDPRVVLGQLGAPKRDECRVDVRSRSKDGARDRVEACAYGRQLDSIEAHVACALLGANATLRGVFIRAPRFTRLGTGVEVLATHDGEPVGVRQGGLVALAVPPELTDDARLFRWFLDQVVAPARATQGAAR